MGKSLYSEFKSVVDQINAFRTGTLGLSNLSLTANPAATQYAKMTAAQVNELQNQSAALSNYITRSSSGCPGHNANHYSNVRSHNRSYLNAHKDTLNSSNYRDNTTYYSGYRDGVLYFHSHLNGANSNLSGPRYNGHDLSKLSGYNSYRSNHYANRASENTAQDTYCHDNAYNSSDLTPHNGSYYFHYTTNYSHRTYHSYYSSKHGGNRTHRTRYKISCTGFGGGTVA